MEQLLAPIYSSLALQVLFGVLACGNVAAPVVMRYQALAKRHYLDPAGLAFYQRSGLWLSLLLGFVATFLPSFLGPVSVGVVGIVALNSLLVGRVAGRMYREP